MITINGKLVNEIEPTATFKGICDGPLALLNYILSNIIFEADVENNIIIKEDKPKGEEKRRLWVKTSWPYALGMLIDGEYQMDYGMTGYPVNIPFLHAPFDYLREGVRALGDGDLADYGIGNTVVTAENRMLWYIFEPPAI